MSNNRRNLTLVAAGVLLAVLTAFCAVDFSSLPYFASSAQANDAAVASKEEEANAKSEADSLVADALRRILSYSSIQARIEYSTTSPEVTGDGSYQEQGALKRRLEVKLRDMENGTLLQINNGKSLWTRCTTPNDSMTTDEPKNARPHGPQLRLAELGCYGLLSQLQQDYDLKLVGSGQLAGESVFVLQGVLNRKALARMLPERAGEIRAGDFATWSELPPGVPAAMLIALGAEDAAPRRIQYRAANDGEAISLGAKLATRETLTIDLRDVQINQPIPPEAFTSVAPSTH